LPGYRVHDALTVAAAAALVPAYQMLAPRPTLASAMVLAGSCLVSGLIFSPDLDVRSQPRRRWGRAGALWWPYEKLLPHRSRLSHGALIGPLFRLAYFFAVSYLLLWSLLWAIKEWVMPVDRNGMFRGWRHDIETFSQRHPDWVALALLGFVIGGLVHTVADVVWSALRPRRRW
jgi:uncharacterized metal-binding protein